MAVLKKAALFIAVILFCCLPCVFADEVSIREEIHRLKERVTGLEQKLASQEKCMDDQKRCILQQNKKIMEYEDKLSKFEVNLHEMPLAPMQLMEGLKLGVGATMIVQGAGNVNYHGDGHTLKDSRTDESYSADITLEKKFKEVSAEAFLHLEAGQGSGLEDNLVLYSNVNRDAGNDNNVCLTEFWYEQGLFDDQSVLTFGKLDPTAYFDQNDVANSEATQFLGRIFRNSPAIEFPDNTAGVRFAYLPFEWLELGYGIFDGNSDWEKIGDNLFNIGQVHFKTNFFELPGNYRFYAWNNNACHTRWFEPDKTKEAACGFGLSFDQKVTAMVTLFTRYGWQDPEVYNPDIKATGGNNYSLEQSWSAGLQVEGKLWGRKKDVLAFAVGQVLPSDDYKKAGSSAVAAPNAKAEGHLEAYYRIPLNGHLSLSPDFQYIWNPFGKDIADDTSGIFVGGMRAQVDF